MLKAHVEAYGCSASLADSEMICGLLKQADFQLTESESEADVNLIVTCTVKTPTLQRMTYRVLSLTNLKKPLVVAGCMPKTERHLIEAINPDTSLLGPDSLLYTVEAVKSALEGRRSIFIDGVKHHKTGLPRVRVNPIIGILEIGSGCLSSCSFCQVKLAKGSLLSYRSTAILQDAEEALREGCRELWITSQDNACYGRDIDASLPELLEEICRLGGEFMVRVGMMNPSSTLRILDKLIEAYGNEKIFKFLHLPVQSGCDRILKLMRRGYTVQEFLEVVESFRRSFPKLTLSTDVIVGFPTESEDEFQETVQLLREVKPDIVNISRFGARLGTDAAMMLQLDPKVVKCRSEELHCVVKQIALEKNRGWIGWRGRILIDEKVRDAVLGRNFAYKPVVVKDSLSLGSFADVTVVDASPACLKGKVS